MLKHYQGTFGYILPMVDGCVMVAAWLAARLYRRGYNRMATGGDLRLEWRESRSGHPPR